MKNGPNTDGNKLFCDIETVSEPESIKGISEGPKTTEIQAPKVTLFGRKNGKKGRNLVRDLVKNSQEGVDPKKIKKK